MSFYAALSNFLVPLKDCSVPFSAFFTHLFLPFAILWVGSSPRSVYIHGWSEGICADWPQWFIPLSSC